MSSDTHHSMRQRTTKASSRTEPPSSSRRSSKKSATNMDTTDDPRKSLLGKTSASSSGPSSSPNATPSSTPRDEMLNLQNMSKRSQWIVLAIASGCCAAFNGGFAKLTTTELTTSFATGIANLIGLAKVEKGVEAVIRAIFFGLNLIFNGIMWTLFTKALARGTSTTQVSIINTSSNFMVTAILGFLIFSESLPPLWWLGAALLVAGNVIIGRREEDECKKPGEDGHEGTDGGERRPENEEEEGLLVGETVELEESLEDGKKKQEEDILQLGSDEEDLISDVR